MGGKGGGGCTVGVVALGLPEVPGVLQGPFLDRFLFVVESVLVLLYDTIPCLPLSKVL